MKRLFLFVFLVACNQKQECFKNNFYPTQQANAIVGGDIYSSTPGIGVLVLLVEDKVSYCTGFLVEKRKVLTAAHCLKSNIKVLSFRTGPNMVGYDDLYEVESIKQHPDYDPDSHGINDVGYVLLKEDVNVSTLNISQELDESIVGETALYVGYGRTGPNEGGGEKRAVEIQVSNLLDNTIKYTSNTSGMCYGDSGGPVLIDNVVVGISAYMNSSCIKYGFSMRVDKYLDFFNINPDNTQTCE